MKSAEISKKSKYICKKNKMKYWVFIIIIFLASCNAGGQSYKTEHSKITEKDTIYYMKEMSRYLDTTFLNRYEDEISAYEKKDSLNGITQGQILFIGSSSIRKWYDLPQDMYPIPTINRGFGGSTMPEAVYYFNRMVLPYKPASIVLYEGDNDITADFLTHEVVLSSFKLFVQLTENYLPDTHIYFLSIKPSPAREKYLDKMLITNVLIEEYCNNKRHLHYIDITEKMFNSYGEIRRDIFVRDMLHMNREGYKIWAKIIKKALLSNNF
jgi:lysophospholipase L1-like esterase